MIKSRKKSDNHFEVSPADEVADGPEIAKRDFRLYCPPHIDLSIKTGDDLKNLPESFKTNLRTEGVL